MRRYVFAVVVVLCLAAATVLADDINPPTWRGQPGSTMALWEFATTTNPVGETIPVPDVVNNGYGNTILTITPGSLQLWQSTWDGRQGVWPLSGNILVDIDNRPLPLDHKEIWVQLTWQEEAPGNRPIISALDSLGIPFAGMVVTQMAETSAGGIWLNTTYQILISPNPDFERVRIDGGINIDELVIDTICVPEPATIGLLALGGLVFARKRRA